MTKQLVIAAICMLLVTSCTPPKPDIKLDGTSKEAYEKSLILMSSGLSSDERVALSEAISIIQAETEGLSQVDKDANDRIKVSGKSRTQLLDEARTIVLKYFDENSRDEEFFNSIRDKIHCSVQYSQFSDGRYKLKLKVENKCDWDIKITSCFIDPPKGLEDFTKSVFISILGNQIVKSGETKVLVGETFDSLSKDNIELTSFNIQILGRLVGKQDVWTIQQSIYPIGDSFLKHIGQQRKKPG